VRERTHVVVGRVTVTNETTQLEPHNTLDQRECMEQLLDAGANCSIAQIVYKKWLRNLRPAEPHDVVMMNAHPAKVDSYGDLHVEVHDDATGKWYPLVVMNVAVVPSSDFNLIGWSSYADQLKSAGAKRPRLLYGADAAMLPLGNGRCAMAKRRNGLFSLRTRKLRGRQQSVHATANATNWRAGAKAEVDCTKRSVPVAPVSFPRSPHPPLVRVGAVGNLVCTNQLSSERADTAVLDVAAKMAGGELVSGKAIDSAVQRQEEAKHVKQEAKHLDAVVGDHDLSGGDGKKMDPKWGQVVIAKARELVRLFHYTLGHCVSLSAIQSMIRMGQLEVQGEAAVRKYILQMKANELECLDCAQAATNKNHPKNHKSALVPGMWIMDVSGKYWRSKRAFRYVLVVVAPNGKGLFCSFLREKSQVYSAVRRNRKFWERTTGEKMLTLRMDQAGEHTSNDMLDYLIKKGVQPSFIATGASAGAAEAYIHLLQDGMSASLNAYAQMHDTKRPVHLWPEAMEYARFCRECVPCATNDGVSMYEHRTGRPPPIHKMLPWGATVTAFIPRAVRGKGGNKGRVARFMGFVEHGDGYKLYDHKTNTFFTSNSIHPFIVSAGGGVSVERTTIVGAPRNNYGKPENNYFDALNEKSVQPMKEQADVIDQINESVPPEEEDEQDEDLDHGSENLDHDGFADARPTRTREPTQRMNLGHDEWQTNATNANWQHLSDEAGGSNNVHWSERDQLVVTLTRRGNTLAAKAKAIRNFLKARRGGIAITLPEGAVPDTVAQALSGPDALWWRAAIDEEQGNMENKKVFRKVSEEEKEEPPRKPIKSRYVFDLKLRQPSCDLTGPTYRTLPDGRKVRYKCRLVAKGFSQKEGVDFNPDETYAPTPQMESIRLILAQTLGLGWNLRQLDVTAAFLVASLPAEEQMLMHLPNGAGLVKLLKSLYGLRQSAHHWSQEINGTLLKHGFTCVDADRGVYVLYDDEGKLQCCMALHVDDLMISATDDILEEVVADLKSKYDMREENADWFLKIRITRSKDTRSLAISQPEYAASIVKMAGLDPDVSKPASIPMDVPLSKGTDIPLTEEEESEMEGIYETYGTVVGMLGYLSNATRPDLSYSVNQCRAYTSNPRRHHWVALKRIIRYLKGTLNYGLVYSMIHGQDQLTAYSDADWASDADDRKSVTGNVFIYMGAAIGWKSVKQTAVARSTAESELAALDVTARDALWYRKMTEALRLNTSKTVTIFEDNAAASAIANGSKWSSKTKHVATRFFAIRDDVAEKRIAVLPVDTKDNIADFFTKPLARVKFEKFRGLMGVMDVSACT
jgi:hypothetical protein